MHGFWFHVGTVLMALVIYEVITSALHVIHEYVTREEE